MEEEQYRKKSKKAYEHLAEKITAAYGALSREVGSVQLAGLGLGHHSIGLIRGLGAERLELMHLHTMTHGTRRWSGELQKADSTEEGQTSTSPAAPGSASTSPIRGGGGGVGVGVGLQSSGVMKKDSRSKDRSEARNHPPASSSAGAQRVKQGLKDTSQPPATANNANLGRLRSGSNAVGGTAVKIPSVTSAPPTTSAASGVMPKKTLRSRSAEQQQDKERDENTSLGQAQQVYLK